MGLFSSETKIDVETTVSRVIEDGNVNDTIQSSIIKTVLEDDRDLVDDMVNDVLDSPIIKFRRYFNYGRDEYAYGLPNAWIVSNTGNEGPVREVLEEYEGTEVNLEYVRFGFPDMTHFTRQILQNDYGMDFSTNEITKLTNEKGFKVYLKDIEPFYRLDQLEQETGNLYPTGPAATTGYTPERPLNDGDLTSGFGKYAVKTTYKFEESEDADGADVFWVYADDDGEIHEGSFRLRMTETNMSRDYIQAMYLNAAGKYRFFTYLYGSGVYPTLDALHDPSYTDAGTYFPFVVFRSQGSNRGAEKYHDTEEYKTSVALTDKIGLDYQDMSDSIHSNPDIDDVEQAVMLQGVPIDSTDSTDQQYLFEYFYNLYLQGAGSGTWIQDADFRIKLTYEGISFKAQSGTIDSVTGYDSIEGTGKTYEYKRVENVDEEGNVTYTWGYVRVDRPAMTFRKQVTPGSYYEVTVINPVLKYDIYKGEYVKGRIGDDVMLIPLDQSIVDKLPMSNHERLYLRSLHFVFNTMIKTKTKWYSSTAFKVVLVIVTIVITYMTGVDFYNAAMVLLAEQGALALAMTVLYSIIQTVAIQQGIKIIAKEVNPELAMALAVVALIYGAYGNFQTGSVDAAPWANEMLAVSNNLAKAAQQGVAGEFADLEDKYNTFNLMKEEKMEELAEVEDLLGGGTYLDPFTFIGQEPVTVLGEDPSDFYARTVESGNIGTLAFDAIEGYVDSKLSLPRNGLDLPGMTI